MMKASESEEERVRPWHWPRIWWHDQGFWREVATKAIAGLIVVFVGYLFATAAGYIQLPSFKTIMAFVICSALFLGSMLLIVISIGYQGKLRRTREAQGEKGIPRWTEAFLLLLVILVIATVCYLLIAIVSLWGDLGTLFVH